MAKTSKKKSYTEDIVLNKIFKDISEENSENPISSTEKENQQNTYEDDLIKQYREKDVLDTRQKYLSILKMIIVLIITISLVVIFTNYIDTITDQETTTPTPLPQPKVEKAPKPIQLEPSKIESKEIIHFEIKPKKIIPTPMEKPLKKVKTERELAKDMLMQQMKN